MLDNKLPRAVIYLEPNQVSFYSTVTSTIQSMVFGEGVVRDMEVAAVEVLQAQLDTWLKQQNIQSHNAVIILAENVYFKKEFPGKQNALNSAEISAFLDLVPIESPTARIISMAGAAVAVAANKDFYQPIVEVLQKQKVSVVALTPAFVFQLNPAEVWQFNPETARKVVSEWETAQKFSLVGMVAKKAVAKPVEVASSYASNPASAGKFVDGPEDTKIMGLPRVAFLALTFGVLLLIMGVMFYFTFMTGTTTWLLVVWLAATYWQQTQKLSMMNVQVLFCAMCKSLHPRT